MERNQILGVFHLAENGTSKTKLRALPLQESFYRNGRQIFFSKTDLDYCPRALCGFVGVVWIAASFGFDSPLSIGNGTEFKNRNQEEFSMIFGAISINKIHQWITERTSREGVGWNIGFHESLKQYKSKEVDGEIISPEFKMKKMGN